MRKRKLKKSNNLIKNLGIILGLFIMFFIIFNITIFLKFLYKNNTEYVFLNPNIPLYIDDINIENNILTKDFTLIISSNSSKTPELSFNEDFFLKNVIKIFEDNINYFVFYIRYKDTLNIPDLNSPREIIDGITPSLTYSGELNFYTKDIKAERSLEILNLDSNSSFYKEETIKVYLNKDLIDINLDIYNFSNLYSKYSNLSENKLKEKKAILSNNLKKLELSNSNFKEDKLALKLIYDQAISDLNITLDIIDYNLNNRDEIYLTPVVGVLPSEQLNAIPNTGRPYRADTTDGIHRGWDAFAPVGSPIQALSDGIIVRTVSGFEWDDFGKLKYPINSKKLSILDENHNLDIFRGNQIWLKTLNGDVVFYSHLSEFEEGIYEGKFVNRGDILGKVGITGVPEKNYSNSHLHFEVMVNPRDNIDDNYDYSYNEIMGWDWLFRTYDSTEDIINVQRNLFSLN